MATNVNLTSRTARTVLGHRVYLRAKWSSAWTYVPYLFASEVAWRQAPGISTANLVWDYGLGMRQGETTPRVVSRLTGINQAYVKVEIDGHDGTTLRWFGEIMLDGTAREGLVPVGVSGGEVQYVAMGTQPIAAVGLEAALYRHPIRGATWLDTNGSRQRSERPVIFNRPNSAGEPEGNRSSEQSGSSYVFSSQLGAADEIWRTRHIVEYLCAYERPQGPGGGVQWLLFVHPDFESFLPDWDTPVIDPTGMTTGQLLNVLLPRSRMLSWKLEFPEDEGSSIVWLVPVSLFGADVTTDLGTFKKNPRQVNLQTTTVAGLAADVAYTLEDSDIPRIDQARVRGARRTSTCTLSSLDDTLDKGWPGGLEGEYENGYSTAGDYGLMSVHGKRAANEEVRSNDRLFAVYRRFAIPTTWDQKVKDGLGDGAAKPVFLANDNSTSQARRVNPREIELAPTLPLKDGFNYQSIGSLTNRTAPAKVSDGPHNRLPALVLFKTPAWAGGGDPPWVQVDAIGTTGAAQVTIDQNRHWSARVEVPHQDRAVLLHVSGEPQHVLAFSNFTRLSTDIYIGEWDWHLALFTVCLLDDRHAEGVYPPDAEADDAVVSTRRELVVDAGESYKLDYIVPGTVIGIDTSTRGLVRCNTGGWINDDRKPLAARARQIFEYYGQTRRSLVLETPIVNGQIAVGAYIENFGSEASPQALGTVVSEIVLTIPGGRGELPAPRIRYTTAFAELETSELLNKRPEMRQPSVRAIAKGGG